MSFGERVKELRKKKGITQQGLADDFFVSRQAVTKWETNRSMPDTETIFKLAEYFNVSANYLINGQEEHIEPKAPLINKSKRARIALISSISTLAIFLVVIVLILLLPKLNVSSIPTRIGAYFSLDGELNIKDLKELDDKNVPFFYLEDNDIKSNLFSLNSNDEYEIYLPQDTYDGIYLYNILLDDEGISFSLDKIYLKNMNKILRLELEGRVFNIITHSPIKSVAITSYDFNMRPIQTDVISILDNGYLYSSISGDLNKKALESYHVMGAISYSLSINYYSENSEIVNISSSRLIDLYIAKENQKFNNLSYLVEFIV